MTSLATASDFQKDFLPGYTGHVPSKNERFGATTEILRETSSSTMANIQSHYPLTKMKAIDCTVINSYQPLIRIRKFIVT